MTVRACVLAIVLSLFPGAALAQVKVPDAALAAEGEGRWQDALRLYDAIVAAEPRRADIWIRVADIRAKLNDLPGSIAALKAAAAASPANAELFARLSRACASAGDARGALAAIKVALSLSPNDLAYLRATGELGSWAGDYDTARAAYLHVLEIAPDDAAALLAAARVHVWDGETDAAADLYERYVKRSLDDEAGCLEWGRAESWRGNDAAAARVVARCRQRFGQTDAYRLAATSILTRGGRPGQALDVLQPLRAGAAANPDVALVEAQAFTAAGNARPALRARNLVPAAAGRQKELADLARQMRIAFGSTLQPSAGGYSDSDGLRHYRVPFAASVALVPAARLEGGFQRDDLRAREGSGLDGVDGRTTASARQGWMGVTVSPQPAVRLHARGGRAGSDARDEWTYGIGVAVRGGDRLRLAYDREHALMLVSPRTVSLGLLHDVDRGRLSWMPSFTAALDADVSREAISDGNTRWSARLAPRVAVVRNQRLNLDVGASAYVFTAGRDFNHGYYDPERYQMYALTLAPYLKFSENTGLSLFAEAGAQKDEQQRGFEAGGSAAAELTAGIYRAWVLKITAAVTVNGRLESGAFRGYSGGVSVTRRF